MPNPKPKPPRVVNLESLCRVYTEANIRKLAGLANGARVPKAIAIEAIKILLDRGWGKPKQVKEHTGAGGTGPIVVEIVYQRAKGESTE